MTVSHEARDLAVLLGWSVQNPGVGPGCLERLRGEVLTTRHYTNLRLPLPSPIKLTVFSSIQQLL